MTPKISVIVPVYNVEKYLPRCIDSILSQTFKNFELLLIDDGSPDNSGKICDEYAKRDSRVKVFHKPNGGVSSARNLGLDKASGEWVTFIDADDYIEQYFFDIPEDVAEDLLISNYQQSKDEESFSHHFERTVIPNSELIPYLNKNLHLQIFLSPWAKFFKTSLIRRNNIYFLKTIKVGEDALFVLDYLLFTKTIRFLGNSNYVYVGGFQVSKYKQSVEKSIEAFQETIIRYDKLKVESKTFLIYRFVLYYNLIFPKNRRTLQTWRKNSIVKTVHSKIHKDLGFKWNLIYNNYALFKMYPLFERYIKSLF